MTDAPSAKAPPWAWFNTSMLFLIAALVFGRASALADGWFARLGPFAFMGMVLDMALIFLAAFITASMFMRKYGYSRPVRRKLGLAYAIAFTLWNAASFLLVADLLAFAPVTLGLGGFALVEALIGSAAVFAAVFLRGRLFERNHARGAALGGMS